MELYHEGNRALQERFDTRRLPDRDEKRIEFPSCDGGTYLSVGDAHAGPCSRLRAGDPAYHPDREILWKG